MTSLSLTSQQPRDLEQAIQEFDDLADDVLRSDHTTFDDNLRSLIDFQRSSPFGQYLFNEFGQLSNFDVFMQEANDSVGSMVGSGRMPWPRDPKAKLFLQTRLLTSIANEEYSWQRLTQNFYYAGSQYADNINKLNEQLVRPYLREYRKLLVSLRPLVTLKATEIKKNDESSAMDIFISHSSKDAGLASAVVKLLRVALNLAPQKIRSTSTPGSRLPLGAYTDEQLKLEVVGCRVFVAILTPASLKSPYVLFELGARWGKGLFLGPILAKGASAEFLGGPVRGINALNATEESDLHQFLDDISREICQPLNSPGTFLAELRAVAIEAAADEVDDPRSGSVDGPVRPKASPIGDKEQATGANGESHIPAFDSLTEEERKMMSTFWRVEWNHEARNLPYDWAFTVPPAHADYQVFRRCRSTLKQRKLITDHPGGLVGLSDLGVTFGRMYEKELLAHGDFWSGFAPSTTT